MRRSRREYVTSTIYMTDMGELDNFLNAKFTRTAEKITVSQTHYCEEMLQTFDFVVAGKTSKTP